MMLNSNLLSNLNFYGISAEKPYLLKIQIRKSNTLTSSMLVVLVDFCNKYSLTVHPKVLTKYKNNNDVKNF